MVCWQKFFYLRMGFGSIQQLQRTLIVPRLIRYRWVPEKPVLNKPSKIITTPLVFCKTTLISWCLMLLCSSWYDMLSYHWLLGLINFKENSTIRVFYYSLKMLQCRGFDSSINFLVLSIKHFGLSLYSDHT